MDPKQVEDRYLIVFADASEWVQLPNTHGMAYRNLQQLDSSRIAAMKADSRRILDEGIL